MPRWRLRRHSAVALLAAGAAVALGTTLPAGSASAPPGAVHADGPPLAHTGGFGEPTCAQCHAGESVNDPQGALRLSGLPARYQPGRTYVLVVELARPGLTRAGFELSVRSEAGAVAGAQAGDLAATDGGVAVRDTSTGVRYAMQTLAGSVVSALVARWRVRWTAPQRGAGSVVANVAANASNDDNSPFGDFVYVGAWHISSTPGR